MRHYIAAEADDRPGPPMNSLRTTARQASCWVGRHHNIKSTTATINRARYVSLRTTRARLVQRWEQVRRGSRCSPVPAAPSPELQLGSRDKGVAGGSSYGRGALACGVRRCLPPPPDLLFYYLPLFRPPSSLSPFSPPFHLPFSSLPSLPSVLSLSPPSFYHLLPLDPLSPFLHPLSPTLPAFLLPTLPTPSILRLKSRVGDTHHVEHDMNGISRTLGVRQRQTEADKGRQSQTGRARTNNPR